MSGTASSAHEGRTHPALSPRRHRTDSWTLLGCGLIILLALGIFVYSSIETGSAAYVRLMGAAAAAYLGAVWIVFRSRPEPRWMLAVCLLMAVVWRLPLALTPAGKNNDAYRYLWDARLIRLGYNPYLVVPADPHVAWLHTAKTRLMNNADVPTPYPPGAQLFFLAVTSFGDSVLAIRLALILCDALIVLVMLKWLTGSGRSPWLTLVYAWNPLVAFEGAGNGHIDALGALLLAISALALARRLTTAAALAFSLAVSVKLLPIVLAPLYWRRIRLRDAALATALLAAMYLPFLAGGDLPVGSLGIYIERFRFNDPVFDLLEPVFAPQTLAALATAAGLALACVLRFTLPARSPAAWAWPIAAALVPAPVVYPWYLVWFAPFLTVAANLPLMVWTLSVLATYRVWHLARLGGPWKTSAGLLLFEFGAVALASVLVFGRRLVRTRGSSSDERA